MSIQQRTLDNGERIVNHKLKTMRDASQEALLNYFVLCRAQGYFIFLDNDSLRRLAARIGTNVRELRRLLDDFARAGNIRFSTLRGKPIAVPCRYAEDV